MQQGQKVKSDPLLETEIEFLRFPEPPKGVLELGFAERYYRALEKQGRLIRDIRVALGNESGAAGAEEFLAAVAEARKASPLEIEEEILNPFIWRKARIALAVEKLLQLATQLKGQEQVIMQMMIFSPAKVRGFGEPDNCSAYWQELVTYGYLETKDGVDGEVFYTLTAKSEDALAGLDEQQLESCRQLMQASF